MEGKKFDEQKLPLHLLPLPALEEVARVLQFGAYKYDEWNWAKGMRWSRLWSAAMRHLWAWKQLENKDPESSLNHLAHAACCMLMLLTYQLKNLGEDDRYDYNDYSNS